MTIAEDRTTAGDYSKEQDLAFFVVNFGYTKADYLALTPREKAFVYRAWEDKIVRDSQLVHDANLLAEVNAHRKKGRSVQPLWRKQGAVDPVEMARLVHEEKKKDISGILRKLRGKQ